MRRAIRRWWDRNPAWKWYQLKQSVLGWSPWHLREQIADGRGRQRDWAVERGRVRHTVVRFGDHVCFPYEQIVVLSGSLAPEDYRALMDRFDDVDLITCDIPMWRAGFGTAGQIVYNFGSKWTVVYTKQVNAIGGEVRSG